MNRLEKDFERVQDFFLSFRENCRDLVESLEPQGKKFYADKWKSPLGRGSSNVLEGGKIWEKVGVNFSSIKADSLPPAASKKNSRLAQSPYKVCGISVVAHPLNPFVPASHLNMRFFLVDRRLWWFGGGFDLTPYYPFEKDCILWHGNAERVCNDFETGTYEEFKKNCDDYFYLPHRREMRGIGGLFFDDLNRRQLKTCFAFTQAVGECYLKNYMEIVQRRKDSPYGDEEREFQLYRRGRYAEFNLLHDRGTLFGLQAGGRTESILMSLPPLVKWSYKKNTSLSVAEERLMPFLRPKDWAARIDGSS